MIHGELIVDNFAGGGGASTGIELATGYSVDIAINHDPEAIKMHKANHPNTKHYCENVWQVDPVEECRAAVEKQTARKGIREEIKKGYNRGMHHYYCPVCYEKGDLRNKYNVGLYCSDCGQKLDWRGEE